MASSSGTSSGSGFTQLQNSGSEEDLQLLMNQRKQKRMLSNRESARRSRMRKQKHLDDLMAQVSQLRKDNSQILTNLHITTQQYINIESENSVLRAQKGELGHRLHSLNEIINYLDANNIGGSTGGVEQLEMETDHHHHHHHHHQDPLMINDTYMNPWNSISSLYMNQQQPIMASADCMLQY